VTPWAWFGAAGQAVFLSRLLVQWVASEMRGRSVVPACFWWLGAAGSAMLVVYAARRGDWPIAVGQFVTALIYARNIHLIVLARHSARGVR
jgi:lipid-A-disaccharide synthase-like uncharacterized protein